MILVKELSDIDIGDTVAVIFVPILNLVDRIRNHRARIETILIRG